MGRTVVGEREREREVREGRRERGKEERERSGRDVGIVSNEGPEHEAPAITDRFRRSQPPASHLSAAQPSKGHPPS